MHLRIFGLLLAGFVVVGGCRSRSTDRIRVLEAKHAAEMRKNDELARQNADFRARTLEMEASLKAEEARRQALQSELLVAQRTEAAPAAVPEKGFDASAIRNTPGVRVENRGGNPTIVLSSDVTFRPGRADLNKEAVSALGQVARALQNVGGVSTVRIEGHTDSDPIRKSGWKSNRALSLARAQKVQRYLVSRGIDQEVLLVEGHGSERPVASNKTAAGKAQNRRVEIVVVSD